MNKPAEPTVAEIAAILNPEPTQETEEEQETEAALEAGQETAETAEDADGIATLADLARELEIEPEDLYEITLPTGDGGDPYTIGQLKDRVQELRVFDAKRQAFEQEREAWNQQVANEKTQLATQQQRYVGMPQELLSAEGELTAIQQEYAGVDWNQLEATDPGRAALERQRMNDRMSHARYKRDMVKGQYTQAQQQAQMEALNAERQKMLDTMPEWRDEGKFKQARTDIIDHMGRYGISEQEAMGIADHRVLKMVYEAAEQAKGLSTANAAKKKASEAPKTIRPGAVKAALSGKRATVEKLAKRARSTRKPDDVKRAAVALLQSKGIV